MRKQTFSHSDCFMALWHGCDLDCCRDITVLHSLTPRLMFAVFLSFSIFVSVSDVSRTKVGCLQHGRLAGAFQGFVCERKTHEGLSQTGGKWYKSMKHLLLLMWQALLFKAQVRDTQKHFRFSIFLNDTLPWTRGGRIEPPALMSHKIFSVTVESHLACRLFALSRYVKHSETCEVWT